LLLAKKGIINNNNLYDGMGVEFQSELLCREVFSLYDKHYPVKVCSVSARRAGSPWMTDALLKCVKRKHLLNRLAAHNPACRDEYKNYRNI
jgi:hypothetical protein